jgi:hypothetical protein
MCRTRRRRSGCPGARPGTGRAGAGRPRRAGDRAPRRAAPGRSRGPPRAGPAQVPPCQPQPQDRQPQRREPALPRRAGQRAGARLPQPPAARAPGAPADIVIQSRAEARAARVRVLRLAEPADGAGHRLLRAVQPARTAAASSSGVAPLSRYPVPSRRAAGRPCPRTRCRRPRPTPAAARPGRGPGRRRTGRGAPFPPSRRSRLTARCQGVTYPAQHRQAGRPPVAIRPRCPVRGPVFQVRPDQRGPLRRPAGQPARRPAPHGAGIPVCCPFQGWRPFRWLINV